MIFAHASTWPGLHELGESQAGVVSRSQLARCGTGRQAIRKQIIAGRWRPAGPRVVVLHTGQLTRTQQWWIAVLHAGQSACLAGHTAAEAAGLTGWEREPTHVLVPKGARVPCLAGAVIHESRRFSAADIH
ncbi:MAG TPA: hypothetical protein VE287_04500, partial [Actinopolymorphaceae bacterium]|nr:hypothetical protein [Actinopolymorphaceae bacterium]